MKSECWSSSNVSGVMIYDGVWWCFWAKLEIKLAFLCCMAQNSKAKIPRCQKMMNSISH